MGPEIGPYLVIKTETEGCHAGAEGARWQQGGGDGCWRRWSLSRPGKDEPASQAVDEGRANNLSGRGSSMNPGPELGGSSGSGWLDTG